MTYTTPFTAVVGATITAAGHNTSIRDNIIHLRALLPDASGASLPLVSASTTTAAFGQLPTAGIADLAVTTAKVAALAITNAKINDVDGSKIVNDSISSGKLASNSVITANISDGNVTNAKIATVDGSKIIAGTITSGKFSAGAIIASDISDGNVTAAKLGGGAAASNIGSGGVSAAMLAAGVAVSNLGFTPSRITSSSYTGNGASTARQITTGYAVKLVIIHDSANDTMYIAINTTNSLRLASGPSVQGSSSVHVHATDGFTVADGTTQGNVNTNTYSYTTFG